MITSRLSILFFCARVQTWKKRWFVLRPAHLAYYKTSAEYQLHRLLDLHEVHTCTPVSLKKHENTFGVVSAARTFYLQAETQAEMQAWVSALKDAKEALLATSTTNSLNAGIGAGAPAPPQSQPQPHPHPHAAPAPIPIPIARPRDVFHHPHAPAPVTPSPPSHGYRGGSGGGITSSDSEDGSPNAARGLSSSPTSMPFSTSPSGKPAATATAKDASKATVIAGYIMKCGSKRRNWRKRWFVLNGEKLMYSGSHMVRLRVRVWSGAHDGTDEGCYLFYLRTRSRIGRSRSRRSWTRSSTICLSTGLRRGSWGRGRRACQPRCRGGRGRTWTGRTGSRRSRS